MKWNSTLVYIAAFTLACINLQAQLSNYTVTFLGQGNSYFEKSAYARALNNEGQVVGDYTPASGVKTAFLYYPNGTILDLGTLGGLESFAININDAGQVIGFLYDVETDVHSAFLYENGKMTDLGSLQSGEGISLVSAINSKGQIVGYISENGPSSDIAVIFSQDKITTLRTLDDVSGPSQAAGINNNYTNSSTGFSDVVGTSAYFDNYSNSSVCCHAFLYSNSGAMVDIGAKVLPGFSSQAISINDAKQIVGVYVRSEYSALAAFFYDSVNGNYEPLVIGYSNNIYDINNKGQAIGSYVDGDGEDESDFSFLYMDGKTYYLLDFIPSDAGLNSTIAFSINDKGQIIANTNKGVVLLTPTGGE